MTNIDLLGMAAGTLTTISFLPQVIKILKTKSTRDISLITFLVLIIGALLWLTYGVLLGSFPIVFFNSVGLLLYLVILICKIIYK